jgi:hypothetical protein
MNIDAAFFVIATGLMTLIFVGFIVYGLIDGQFKDLNEIVFNLDEGDEE